MGAPADPRAANAAYFATGAWKHTTYAGIPVFKYTEDLWTYQEIVVERRPDLIIETGTANGGAALWFAHLLERFVPGGHVITIDPLDYNELDSPTVTYLEGSSLDPVILAQVRRRAARAQRVMVSLDSEHLPAHVKAELEVYAPLVSDGQYLVVEDTFIDRYGCEEVVVDDKGRELEPRFAAGSSWQALEAWLPDHPRFTVDAARDRHLLSMNPGGWLRAAEVHPDEQPVATIRHTAPEP